MHSSWKVNLPTAVHVHVGMWERHGRQKEDAKHISAWSTETRWQLFPVFEWQGSAKETIQDSTWLWYKFLTIDNVFFSSAMVQRHMTTIQPLVCQNVFRLYKLLSRRHVNFPCQKTTFPTIQTAQSFPLLGSCSSDLDVFMKVCTLISI